MKVLFSLGESTDVHVCLTIVVKYVMGIPRTTYPVLGKLIWSKFTKLKLFFVRINSKF